MSSKPTQLTGENRLIRLLRDRYGGKSSPIIMGIGDDAAVFGLGRREEIWTLTTDMLLENIDFRREWITPFDLGYKSISVNLSDLASMGARPRFYTVSLGLPEDISERWVLRFYDGLTELGCRKGAFLIGGDLSRSEGGIVISITAMGESLHRKVLYRSGGRAGDALYVTGVLGRSAAGLKLLEKGLRPSSSKARMDAIRAHRKPEPRCEAGLWLAQSGMVRCMMDLSDGLSVDLPRLCDASRVGAEVHAARIPVFSGSASWGCDPLRLALHGGEDFELLFSVSPSRAERLETEYPACFPKLTRIGRLTRDAGKVWLVEPNGKRRRLAELGYDHFRGRSRGRRSGARRLPRDI